MQRFAQRGRAAFDDDTGGFERGDLGVGAAFAAAYDGACGGFRVGLSYGSLLMFGGIGKGGGK